AGGGGAGLRPAGAGAGQGRAMKIHTAGSHLMERRSAQVEDWSLRATARRARVLGRLARPYAGRVSLGIAALLAATGRALAPPYLL
ncbi:MAG: hypothetical protein ACXVZL_10375, partial [Gaiellaceae bacterium]